MNREEKRLVCICNNGLSNRLRALVSAQRLADRLNRRLQVVWVTDRACDEKFSRLFENRLELSEKTLFRVKIENKFRSFFKFNRRGVREVKNVYCPVGLEESIKGIRIPEDAVCATVESGEWIFLEEDLESMPMPGGAIAGERLAPAMIGRTEFMMRELRPYLQRLVPVKEIEETVRAFRAERPGGFCVGVHIRLFEDRHRPDRMKMVDRFAARMSLFQDERKAVFFLATDEGDVEERLSQRFGENIRFYPKQRKAGGFRKSSVRDALVDLLLLSQTDYLLGTELSSFSQVAVLMGGRPHEYIAEP